MDGGQATEQPRPRAQAQHPPTHLHHHLRGPRAVQEAVPGAQGGVAQRGEGQRHDGGLWRGGGGGRRRGLGSAMRRLRRRLKKASGSCCYSRPRGPHSQPPVPPHQENHAHKLGGQLQREGSRSRQPAFIRRSGSGRAGRQRCTAASPPLPLQRACDMKRRRVSLSPRCWPKTRSSSGSSSGPLQMKMSSHRKPAAVCGEQGGSEMVVCSAAGGRRQAAGGRRRRRHGSRLVEPAGRPAPASAPSCAREYAPDAPKARLRSTGESTRCSGTQVRRSSQECSIVAAAVSRNAWVPAAASGFRATEPTGCTAGTALTARQLAKWQSHSAVEDCTTPSRSPLRPAAGGKWRGTPWSARLLLHHVGRAVQSSGKRRV